MDELDDMDELDNKELEIDTTSYLDEGEGTDDLYGGMADELDEDEEMNDD